MISNSKALCGRRMAFMLIIIMEEIFKYLLHGIISWLFVTHQEVSVLSLVHNFCHEMSLEAKIHCLFKISQKNEEIKIINFRTLIRKSGHFTIHINPIN